MGIILSVLIACHNSFPLPLPQQLCDSTSYCETRYGSNSGSNPNNFRGADPVNNQRTVGGSDDDGSFTKEYLFDQDFPFGIGNGGHYQVGTRIGGHSQGGYQQKCSNGSKCQ